MQSVSRMMRRYAFGQTIQDYDDSVRINYMGTVNTLFGVVPRMIQRNHVGVIHPFHA